MKHNYVVYRHIFPNGKSYIGITCAKPVSRRWRGGSGYKGQPKIYNAILKYGWENTEHEVLVDNITFCMAKKLEQKFIKEYNSIKEGYNITEGGEGTKGKKCSEETKAKISAANKGKPNLNGTNNLKKYQKEYGSWNKGKKLKGEHYRKIVEERKKRCNKEIIAFDIYTDEEVMRFESVTEAAVYVGISKECISRCANGGRKTSGGYKWRFANESE